MLDHDTSKSGESQQIFRERIRKGPPGNRRAVQQVLLNGLKVCGAVLAQGADNVVGQGVALIDPAADLAHEAFLALGLGLGLDVVLVVGVGHGLLIGDHPGLGDGADEHAVGVQVHKALHLQVHEGVDIPGQEPQAVVGAQLVDSNKFVSSAAALEAEVLEHREGGGHIQAVDVHHAGLLDDMVGIIGLVDGDRHPVGGVGDLGDGIDDQAVVLGAIVGGDDVQAIADVEQGGQVILVGGGVLLGQIILAQLVGQSFYLGFAVVIQSGQKLHGGVGKGQVLAALEHLAHDLGGQRRPGAVFHQTDGAVLVVPLSQMVDEFLHEGEYVGVIGGGGQHQLAVTEGILHSLGHIGPGQVMDDHLGAALGFQLLHQQLYCGLGVAVDGGVGHHDALALHPVGGPDVVQIDVVAQILGEDGAVEGADDGDIQRGGLFQQSLDLGTVLAHDTDVIPPRLIGPVLFHIQRAELAKTVGGEQDFVIGIIGNDNLRPVDHGGGNKRQGVLTQAQGIALADDNAAVGIVISKELLHHGESLGGGYHSGLGIDLQEIGNVGGVVRLHMLHHQIIRLAALEGVLDVVQPFVGKILVHGVHDGDLVIHNGVGIVGHTVGDHILPLEQVDLVVIDTDVADILGNGHSALSLCILIESLSF